MTKEVKGVFVRLPLSEESEDQFDTFYGMGGSLEMAIVNLGAPVTGDDIPVVTTLGTLRDPVPCVRQSDAKALIAALEAEVVRLRETMKEIELGIDALSSEEDDGGRMTSSEMKRRALEVIRSEVKALKGGAA